MIRAETEREKEFRATIRDWLSDNLPRSLRNLTFRPPPDVIMPWYKALSARGWVAPHWPKAHGGMEASAVEQVILIEELTRTWRIPANFMFIGCPGGGLPHSLGELGGVRVIV